MNHIQTENPTLPSTGFIRVKDVLKFIPVSRSGWWEGVRNGRYPKPIKISEKITAWRVEDIRSLIESLSCEGEAD